MNFTDPQPLTEILGKLDARTPIGSVLRSEAWETVPAALRDRAVFSAGVESVRWLSEIDNGIKDIVARAQETNAKGETYFKTDRAKLVADLRQLGQRIGIPHPDGDRKDGKIRENDLKDPLSIRRLKLITNTQLAMAQGYGDYLASQDPTVLEQWPAQELVRISPKANPRAWKQRWAEAGGKLHDGRMIARKDSPIWVKISRFGNPYPPFDYESGMGIEDVDYDEAVQLGVIQEGDEVRSQVKDFNEGLESSVKNLTPKQQGWLKDIFGDQVDIADGAARWKKNPVEPTRKTSDNGPRERKQDNAPTPPAISPGSGIRKDGGSEAADPAAIREDIEAGFRAALGESYPEIHSPAGGFQKGLECHIAAASLGGKPVYFDPWGEEFGAKLAFELSTSLPAGARVELADGNLFVFTDEAAQKIIDQSPDKYAGKDLFEKIRNATATGDNGFLLGYHTLNDRIRPAVKVSLTDAKQKLFVQFYTTIENVDLAIEERIRDLRQGLPGTQFESTWEIMP